MVFGSQSPCRLVWIRKHRPGRREGVRSTVSKGVKPMYPTFWVGGVNVISIVVAPSSCCVTAPLWRCDAESGSHPPHLVWSAASSNANGEDGREAEGAILAGSGMASFEMEPWKDGVSGRLSYRKRVGRRGRVRSRAHP